MSYVDEVRSIIEQKFIERANNYINKIKQFNFIKDAYLQDTIIKIEFTQEVNIKDQDAFGVFMQGGAIKKSDSKDNEEEYFYIDPIGEF